MKKLLVCLTMLICCSNLFAMEEITSTEQDSKKNNVAFYAANIAKVGIGLLAIPASIGLGNRLIINRREIKDDILNDPIKYTPWVFFNTSILLAPLMLAGDGLYQIINKIRIEKKNKIQKTIITV